MRETFFQRFKKSWRILLPCLFLVSCSGKKAPQNFILITLDTQRADFISAYNSSNAHTPSIDSLAERGILFENCYSLIPITLPSHASVFFSEPPSAVKNYNNGQEIRKKRARPSFVNLFKKRGFSTAAFISLGVLKSRFGLSEAFDVYEDEFPVGRWYLSAGEVNQKVFSWLEGNRDRNFFLWVHYSDPHDPYAPPSTPSDFKLFLNEQLVDEYCLSKYTFNRVALPLKPGKNQLRLEVRNDDVDNPDYFKARLDRLEFSPEHDGKDLDIHFSRGWLIRRDENVFFFKDNSYIDIFNNKNLPSLEVTFRGKLLLPMERIREGYKDEVEYMDGEIGKLLDRLAALGISENTAILLFGDHGEGLGEYNIYPDYPHIGHIHFLYGIYLKVPLILYHPPSLPQGIRNASPVTLLDVAPTISKIMNFETLGHYQGRNLLRLKKREKYIFFEETYRPESICDRFGLFSFPWHLIFTPEDNAYELFDLRGDPEEKDNVFTSQSSVDEVLHLKEQLDAFARNVLKGKEEYKIDKKTEEMLRALGYIR